MVFSNLPGPGKPVTFGKKLLLGTQVIFPNLIPQGLAISYGGDVFINLCISSVVASDFTSTSTSTSDSDSDVDGGTTNIRELLRKCYLDELKELAISYGITAKEEEILDSSKQYLTKT
jgi:hypothetical protein